MSQALRSYSLPPMTAGAARVNPAIGPSPQRVEPDGGAGPATALATGAIGIDALLAFLGADAKNKAISNAMARVREQGATQVRQQQTQADDARRQRIRTQREAAGRLRVLRASGLGGSFDQRARNLAIDADQDLFNLNRNLGLNVMSTTQSVNNNLINLNNQKQNPLLAGATAGLQATMQAARAAASAGVGG